MSATGYKRGVCLVWCKSGLFDQVGVNVMHDMLKVYSKCVMNFILEYYIKES